MPGKSVIGRHVTLVSQDAVAARLKVTSQAISMWYSREAEDTAAGKPAWGLPAFTPLYDAPGKKARKVWREAQLPVWELWFARHNEQVAQRAAERAARRRVPVGNDERKMAA